MDAPVPEPPAATATDTPARPPVDVFVSYASQDAALADAVVASLERQGLRCWIAPRDVVPGSLYADGIVRAINESRVLVLVLSAHAVESAHVGKEIERASSKRRPIIALRTDAAPLSHAFEYFLSESQWIDLGASGVAAAAEALGAAIKRHLAPAPEAPARAGQGPGARRGPPARRRHRALAVALVVVSLALAWLVAEKLWRARHAAAERPVTAAAPAAPAFAPPARSIAVLPFVNMSGDPAQDYFSDGISEELLSALSRRTDLQVAARTSSFTFKGQTADVATIGRKLNVGALLEGSVRRAGSTVRITVQLINAETGFQMWSQSYDREVADILKVQTDVATAVARQLKLTLTDEVSAQLELGGTRNEEAYDAYLRAEQLLTRVGVHSNDTRRALADLDRAIALDPGYARAHSQRAWALHGLVLGAEPRDRAALRAQALAAAERAVALAPQLGEAHAALASVRAYALFDWTGAAPEFERALALAPGSAQVETEFAFYAADLGHRDASIGAARRAVSLDPQNPWAHAVLGSVLLYARRYDEALQAYHDTDVLQPGSPGLAAARAQTLLAAGRVEQARLECESPATALHADDRHHCLALAYHALGRPADAAAELAKFQALDGDAAAYDYAATYAQWGRVAESLQWLSKAERLRDPLFWLLKVDWHLDPLRDQPQFQELVERMHFPP